MTEFIKGDVEKMRDFINEKDVIINEFRLIREEFDNINKTLLSNWNGDAASAYKIVADGITEKIGGISDVLNSISENILEDVVATYDSLDNALSDNLAEKFELNK